MQGTKRKQPGDSPSQLYSNRSRARPSIVEARVDPTYGQRSALPGLDSDVSAAADEHGLAYDDDSLDALSYLRSVRQEATTIPNLLVAPSDPTDARSRDNYTYEGGENGYYEDGAYYTANPGPSSSSIAGEAATEEEIEPQFAYFDSILSRFSTLRIRLQQIPPPEALARLGVEHPITPPAKARKSHTVAKWWRSQMQDSIPAPAQIACMDKGTVLRALAALTGGKLLRSGVDIKLSVSLWTWALLARLPERGELSSEEIGIVRELGKRAVLVGVGLSGEQEWQDGMHEVEAGLDEDDEEDEGAGTFNQDENLLDIDDDVDYENDSSLMHSEAMTDTPNHRLQIGPQLPKELNHTQDDETHRTGYNTEDIHHQSSITTIKGQPPSDEPQQDSEEAQFATAKARMLANLQDDAIDLEINLEPEITPEPELEVPESAVKDTGTSKPNTRATVDMIITVAGEIYGQRDLLEFRPAWRD